MEVQSLNADIAVIGASMGGVAAALAACETGAAVILTEPTDWLGGQMTSQGTSALDEHRHIEYFGGTRRYYALRERIREHYRQRFGLRHMPDGSPLNPGNAWVSSLCFEPLVGVQVLETMLAPYVASGNLIILYGYTPIAANIHDDLVQWVVIGSSAGERDFRIRARMFLDATELGDLLPLVGAESVVGAESHEDTGEPFAPTEPARLSEVQSFTFPFAVEYCPGENHTIAKPACYEHFRDIQPYTLTLAHRTGPARPFRMFCEGPTGLPPFWTYRRLLDGMLLDPSGRTRDIAMINWPGNDYHYADLVGATPTERAAMLDDARQLSLGFLYWLQMECPRDDTGQGYPELHLLPEIMGTVDGLSKAPYVRESRRIVAKQRILATDILDIGQQSPYAIEYPDSVGIGWYYMDLHPAYGNPLDRFEPTKPFQIPLGALIPVRVQNLLACCKNIGTTHLSNGAYRLHPVEWNLGESAGALAAYCCAYNHTPAEVHAQSRLVAQFQEMLLARGIPLSWHDMPKVAE